MTIPVVGENGEDEGYLCICDEEMCWCLNIVPGPDEPCPECYQGSHVWLPGGKREERVS